MKTERISIGIFDKDTANGIREQIKDRNLVRGQKVKTVFRGRGKRENGSALFNDIKIKDAKRVSVYLDIVTKEDEFVLDLGIRKRMIESLSNAIIKNDEPVARQMIEDGTKGLRHYSDKELVNQMLYYFESVTH